MLSKEQKKEYQKAYMAKKRSNSGSNKEDGSNKPATSDGSNSGSNKGLTRINPRDGKPYGPGMLGLMATPKGQAALTEYERKHGQMEPVYGKGNPHSRLAEYAVSDRFQRIHEALGDLASEVRVGCYGPTVAELWDATH